MTRLRVTRRAAAVVWLAHARRIVAWLAANQARLTPAALVVLGLGGGLGGGALVGEWCLGVVMITEGALVVYVGLNRDDGTGRPPREARTVPEILERARHLP